MLLFLPPEHPPTALSRHAFTLTEMVVVMAIIIVVLGISAPALISLKGSGDLNKAVYDVAGVLEQSRAYAMSNNTYVYVGLEEVDVTQPSSGKQQAGLGRLGVAVVATRDGTQGFSSGSLGNTVTWSAAYPAFARNLITVGKPVAFDNLHVADLGVPPTTGGMVRPTLSSASNTVSECVSATPFDYPAGSGLGTGQYSFTKVIQFDPQGVARIQTSSNPSAIAPYMEIGLEQTHGTSFVSLPVPATTGSIAAIQIDGITGAVRVYRP